MTSTLNQIVVFNVHYIMFVNDINANLEPILVDPEISSAKRVPSHGSVTDQRNVLRHTRVYSKIRIFIDGFITSNDEASMFCEKKQPRFSSHPQNIAT